jgi:hypothetical protein
MSKFQNRLKLVNQIKTTNNDLSEEQLKQIYVDYHNSKDNKFAQLDIRYGPGSGKKHQDLLVEKAKNKASFGRLEFWTNKGFSVEEAEKIKKEHYAELSELGQKATKELNEKRPEKRKEQQRKATQTLRLKKTLQYWTDLGFSLEQAQEKTKKYLNPPKHDLQSFIDRHGEELGLEKYKLSSQKRNETKLKKYGKIFNNPCVSKTSLKFFKPLYKLLRKSGFKKEDIMWGIGGAREFTTKDSITNNNYAYDFTILSKKLIIEFNDPFWHARDKEQWKNPFSTYEESFKKDQHKLEVVKRFGFDIIWVWSDNLPNAEDLKNIIINYEPQNCKILNQ